MGKGAALIRCRRGEQPQEKQAGREGEDKVFAVFPNVGGAHLSGKEKHA